MSVTALKLNFLILLFTISIFGNASDIKQDEDVIIFTTNAVHNNDARVWNINIHGWIYEPEEDSIWRSTLIGRLIKSLDLDDQVVGSEIFKRRMRMFLVDSESNKQLKINIMNDTMESSKTESDGHFYVSIDVNEDDIPKDDKFSPVFIQMPINDDRKFSGLVQLVPESGVSVISDIDDTVKDSNVLDKKSLLKNTFTKPFNVVAGMEKVYQQWADEGAIFHYVSSSPWQLYPSLNDFFVKAGLPNGSFHLKMFRLMDSSILNVFSSPMKNKLPAITEIIRTYPKRKFILVGDSGEKDPEVYAEIYRENSNQIAHIFIRNITNENKVSERYERTFAGIENNKWTIFDNPTELDNFNLNNTE